MKRILAFFVISFVITACGNEANTDATKDTVNTGIAPDNTLNHDTSATIKDTSSYERMPQKSSDTLPH